MAIFVAGLFRDLAGARGALAALQEAGFSRDDIGIGMQDQQQARALAAESDSHVAGDAIAGAVTGGAAGGVGAAVLGLGSLLIPGIGPFIAGGILAVALGGAVAGGLLGAMAGLGFENDEARLYDAALRSGRALVTVRTDEARAPEARAILRRTGAGFYQGGVTATVDAGHPPG